MRNYIEDSGKKKKSITRDSSTPIGGDPYLALKKKILNRYELHDFLSNNEIKYSMDLPSVFGYPPCLETFSHNNETWSERFTNVTNIPIWTL